MLRLRQVCLVARELAPVEAALCDVFDLKVCHRDPAVSAYGLENILLPIGDNFLEVVAPLRVGTAAGRYLDRRGGDDGYIVILQCDDPWERRRRMAALGVRIVNTIEGDDFLGPQLHPVDTGSTMLEVDWNRGGIAPDGPWHPVGAH